jgi:drug/metabolite transporter (DMT)-like permease
VTAPDLAGATLMVAAGACWGLYSLAGRSSRDPLARTAGNFARAAVLAVPFALGYAGIAPDRVVLTGPGLWLAVLSGSLASGVAYTLWYRALPHLAAWRAAIVQLTVPVLTALAAVPLLGEAISPRLVVATALVAGGVWLTVSPRTHRA